MTGLSVGWTVLAAVLAAVGLALALPAPRQRVSARAAPEPAGPRDRATPLRAVSALLVGAGVLAFVGGPVGIGAGAAAVATVWWLTGRMEPPAVRRRREAVAAAVPHAVDLMAACLAAGQSPTSAMQEIALAVDPPLADELSAWSARLRLGVDPVTVWRDLSGHPQLGGLGRAMARAVESGASVADAMLRLADDQRRQERARVEARARSVGVKAALPLGACLLPAFILVGVVPLVAGSLPALLSR